MANGLSALPFDYSQLPENYTFSDLAGYEEYKRRLQGQKYRDQIARLKQQIQSEYDKSLESYRGTTAQRRSSLATSLSENARKTFALNNPYILEDLNARGVFTSPTAVAQAQAQALKELELDNQLSLQDFDASSRSYEDALASQRLRDINELDSAATSAEGQADQDALDAALDLRRGQLQANLNSENASREESLARDLAKKQRDAELTRSFLGVGGNLGSIYLGSKLFGGGTNTVTPSTAGILNGAVPGTLTGIVNPTAGNAASSFFPNLGQVGQATGTGGIGLGGGLAIGAAGLGASLLSRAGKKKAGTLGGIISNPIGYQINKAKEFVSNPGKTISKTVSNIGSSFKKAFCFEGNTMISMEDGSVRPIFSLSLGAKTQGGKVESIRQAESDDIYLYKGFYITGSHAVKENGKWLRIKDSPHAAKQEGEGVVWSIVTSEHRVWVHGIELADEHETDQYESLTMDESLNALNQELKEGVFV